MRAPLACSTSWVWSHGSSTSIGHSYKCFRETETAHKTVSRYTSAHISVSRRCSCPRSCVRVQSPSPRSMRDTHHRTRRTPVDSQRSDKYRARPEAPCRSPRNAYRRQASVTSRASIASPVLRQRAATPPRSHTCMRAPRRGARQSVDARQSVRARAHDGAPPRYARTIMLA